MPFGGSITLGSSLPLILLSARRGTKTGFFASIIYSIVHIFLSFKIPPVKTLFSFIFILLLDYFLPNAILGVSFLFGKRIKSKNFKLYFSTVLSFALRWLISIISGVIFWSDYIPFNMGIWCYSIIYTGLYTIPECLITVLIFKHLLKFYSFSQLFD